MRVQTRLVIAALFPSLFLASSVGAQTTKGNCNAVLQGNGNNVTINCENGTAPVRNKVKVVISSNATPMVLGLINWQVVDPTLSEFWVEVDDDRVAETYMDDMFDDAKVELAQGTHFYTIGLSFTYGNGSSADTECTGVLDAQVPAQIVPRIQVNQNQFTGALSPVRCGFDLR